MRKSKKGEIFGMSFTMIFSIILIVFFLIAAFQGIKFLLNYQKQLQLNLFVKDMQTKIDQAWKCGYRCTLLFNQSINFDYACFIDFSSPIKGYTSSDKLIYDKIKQDSYTASHNLYLYSEDKLESFSLSHLKITKNPICFKSSKDKFSIKFENTGSDLVEVK